jgi:hypothetical protein
MGYASTGEEMKTFEDWRMIADFPFDAEQAWQAGYEAGKSERQSFNEAHPPNPDAKCKCEHWESCAECHPTAHNEVHQHVPVTTFGGDYCAVCNAPMDTNDAPSQKPVGYAHYEKGKLVLMGRSDACMDMFPLYTHPAPSQEPVAWAVFSANGKIIDLLDEDGDGAAPLYTYSSDAAAQIAELESQLGFARMEAQCYLQKGDQLMEQIAKLEADNAAMMAELIRVQKLMLREIGIGFVDPTIIGYDYEDKLK